MGPFQFRSRIRFGTGPSVSAPRARDPRLRADAHEGSESSRPHGSAGATETRCTAGRFERLLTPSSCPRVPPRGAGISQWELPRLPCLSGSCDLSVELRENHARRLPAPEPVTLCGCRGQPRPKEPFSLPPPPTSVGGLFVFTVSSQRHRACANRAVDLVPLLSAWLDPRLVPDASHGDADSAILPTPSSGRTST